MGYDYFVNYKEEQDTLNVTLNQMDYDYFVILLCFTGCSIPIWLPRSPQI